MKKRVVIFGGGPHSKVVLDLMIQNPEFDVVGVVDREGYTPFGLPLLSKEDDMSAILEMDIPYAFAAVGNNRVRRIICEKAQNAGLKLVNVIAPDAVISSFSHIGSGILINHGAIVNAGAMVGDGVILNTGCSVDHDCVIGSFCHIAPGVHISGSTHVGAETLLGTGSSVIDGINIGKHVIVGGGAAVVKDIPDDCTAVGVPAKVILKSK